jgi:hypothetical protein
MTQISGVTFDEAWSSRTTADLDGRPVPFIGRAALLRNQDAAGRPKGVFVVNSAVEGFESGIVPRAGASPGGSGAGPPPGPSIWYRVGARPRRRMTRR